MEDETKKKESTKFDLDIYKEKGEKEWAMTLIQDIDSALTKRETASIISNNLAYTTAYEYNQRKAINYAPPASGANRDDRQVSMGMVNEKIIGFCARFLSSNFNSDIKSQTLNGSSIQNMGQFFELSAEKSFKLEQLEKQVALIYFEMFTQGDAFMEEMWEVKNIDSKTPMKDGQEVKGDAMDYTYEFLDGLKYEKGEPYQTRQAKVRLHDGRSIILGDPEINNLQDQDLIAVEEVISNVKCKQLYGSLSRYDKVPTDRQSIIDNMENAKTLFDSKRISDLDSNKIVHRIYKKGTNEFNIAINGLVMLPMMTSLTIFHPRGNYPLSQMCAERVPRSAYSRSTPAKTKFNADYVDWILKQLAIKFEQGVTPAIIAKGKTTLTSDVFKPRKVTTGVSPDDFTKADPDNKGITTQEFGFLSTMKEIIESQSLNATASGEAQGTTAFEISKIDNAQTEKLAYLLDGIVNGWIDMYARRCETIESKYTMVQRKSMVDGKEVQVYQNFTVNIDGTDNIVQFDESLGGDDYDVEGKRNEIFTKSFEDKKAGRPSEYYIVNPLDIKARKYTNIVGGRLEKKKDTQLEMMAMWDEFGQVAGLFGARVNQDSMIKEYLRVSGRPDDMFIPQEAMQLQDEQAQGEGQAYNTGSFGKPRIAEAQDNQGIKR